MAAADKRSAGSGERAAHPLEQPAQGVHQPHCGVGSLPQWPLGQRQQPCLRHPLRLPGVALLVTGPQYGHQNGWCGDDNQGRGVALAIVLIELPDTILQRCP